MRNSLLLLALFSFFFASCSHKIYNNEAYLKKNSIAGQKIAVLPAKVIFTGKLPQNLTEADKAKLENAESLALQTQLYHELIYRSNRKEKKKSPVQFMEVSVVNQKLQDAGLSLAEASTYDAGKLAQLLGADLVVRTTVRKNRFMSELASLGIGTAVNAANILLSGTPAAMVVGAGQLNKTYDIFFDLNLYDAKNQVSVSKYSRAVEADWANTPEDIFGQNARYFAKRAPVKSE